MFVLSLLSYKLRTKTAKTSFICYKQAVYTVYTVIGHLWNFTANCRIYPQFRLLGHKSREICLKQNNLSRTFVFYMLHVIKPS
ncbi:hypothetical protein HCG69_03050 [Bacteroides sp. K03]|nr:hypothetical protein [Bacteroides sp. K03]